MSDAHQRTSAGTDGLVFRQSDCSCGAILDDRRGQAYNEEAFEYFLTMERKRSVRSRHPFLILLIDLREESGGSAHIDAAGARTLFSGLLARLRRSDLVGWQRTDRVIGAVLPEVRPERTTEAIRVVRQRLEQALVDELPADLALLLRVRVHLQPAPERIVSDSPNVFQPDTIQGER